MCYFLFCISQFFLRFGLCSFCFRKLLFRFRQRAVQHIHLGAADQGTLSPADNLNTLRRRIGPLVKLSGQILNRKRFRIPRIHGFTDRVQLRFREDGPNRIVKQLPVDVFHIIPVQQADPFKIPDAQQRTRIIQQCTGLIIQARFLLHIDSVYHVSVPFVPQPFSARLPISWRMYRFSKVTVSAME